MLLGSYERNTRVTSGMRGRLGKPELRVRLQNREVEWLGQEVVDRSAIDMENVSGIGFWGWVCKKCVRTVHARGQRRSNGNRSKD